MLIISPAINFSLTFSRLEKYNLNRLLQASKLTAAVRLANFLALSLKILTIIISKTPFNLPGPPFRSLTRAKVLSSGKPSVQPCGGPAYFLSAVFSGTSSNLPPHLGQISCLAQPCQKLLHSLYSDISASS